MVDNRSLISDISVRISLKDGKSIVATGDSSLFNLDMGADITTYLNGSEREKFTVELSEALERGKPLFRLSDCSIKDIQGRTRHVSVRGAIENEATELHFTDVSDYYIQLREHNELINRYEQLMLTLKEAVWDWDMENNSIYYSDRWFDMLMLTREEADVSLEYWKQLVHPEDIENTMKALEDHLQGVTDVYEAVYRLKRKDGMWIWVRDRGIKQMNDQGQVKRMIGSHQDITSEKTIRENLEKMIITDEMTNLFNRRHYDTQIRDEIMRAERYGSLLSIIMIDIDLFKQINDTYGHRAGDMALKELSKTIKGKIRNTDSAYRTGGEEFVVIAPETDENCAMKAAERLRKAVSEIRVDTGFGSFSFTISLGIATHVKGDTYSSLNERADVALYQSKESGRNRTSLKLP